jgi:hypothetical protein
MADLDVLVSPREAPAMGQILTGLGYCPNAGDTSRRHSSYYLARLGLRPVYRAGEHPLNPHLVEVHTAVAEERLGISYAMTEDMWAGARPARFGGAEGYLPTPPSLLQHLLIHNCADMMAHKLRLVRLYDVSLVAKRLQETEWADLIAAAQERREERFLYAPLQLTERYFPGSVPPAVIARLEAGSPGSLRQMLRMATAYDLSLCNPKAISFREALCWQRVGRERLRAFARMVLPSPEEMRVKYPQVPAGTSMARYRLLHLVETAKWRGRRLLGLPGRAWVYRDRGGRPGAAPGP